MRVSYLLLLAFLPTESPVAAQEPRRPTVLTISDQVACPSCRIAIESAINLEPPENGFPGTPQAVARLLNGTIVVGFGFDVEMMRYTPTGRLLEHVEPEGDGPGEYRSIYNLAALPGDSVLVVDAMLRRATVIAPSGRAVRTMPFPTAQGTILRTADSVLIVNAALRDPKRAGLPLHEFTISGRIGRSFGDAHPVERPGHEEDVARVTALHGPDSLWVVRTSQRYDLELWPIGDRMATRILRRNATWFPARSYPAGTIPSANEPPAPSVTAAWEDRNGLVWVMLRVADPEWKESLIRQAERPGHEKNGLTYQDPSDYYDMLLEIIDPRAGRLLASHRMDQLLGSTGEPGLFLQMTEDQFGEPGFRLVSLTLVK
jgi:hypothetical protein